MIAMPAGRLFPFPILLASAWLALAPIAASADSRIDYFWQVDDVRPGMKGQGRTVIKGTRIETFEVEVLGVLKNTSPGRDMVLCRLSGLNLEKTGVIAGMSGSPVYLDGKLLGAVAYAWAFGKEPIAGVTPFCQMRGYAEGSEIRHLAEKKQSRRLTLGRPIQINGSEVDAVTVAQGMGAANPAAADGLWMVPLRTPLAATGFTAHALTMLQERIGEGWLPMQAGGASAKIPVEERNAPLLPGSPMVVALIKGDFDLSGIGTVTHIEGDRVYGWGHPFFGIGVCEFPLLTGYIHTVYPRQSVSFKMGSPLRPVGVVNADVSTCLAGWLNRKADMMPLRMTLAREAGEPGKKFDVEVARQRALQPALVYAALTNSVDMEGELPDELTAELEARIELEAHAPIVIKDTFAGSGYAGGRAPQALYNPLSAIVQILGNNPFQPVRINRIDCQTRILSGRRTADIEAVEMKSEVYEPGETVKATVFLRPYKGARIPVAVQLQLPADLPEGNYNATICDDPTATRMALHDSPTWSNPENIDQLLEALKMQCDAKRTSIAFRMPIHAGGVAIDGKTLPDLPPSMVQILGKTKRSGAQPVGKALVARQPTAWVVQGSESVRFSVTKTKKILASD